MGAYLFWVCDQVLKESGSVWQPSNWHLQPLYLFQESFPLKRVSVGKACLAIVQARIGKSKNSCQVFTAPRVIGKRGPNKKSLEVQSLYCSTSMTNRAKRHPMHFGGHTIHCHQGWVKRQNVKWAQKYSCR